MNNTGFKQFNRIFFLVWAVILIIICAVNQESLSSYQILVLVLSMALLIVTTFLFCNYYLPRYILYDKPALLILQIVLMAFFQAFIMGLLSKSIDSLILYFRILPEEEITTQSFLLEVVNVLPVTLLLNLAFGGLKFYVEHIRLHQQHITLQKNHLEAQVLRLQAQINPHYMFNVLNNIHVLMHKDTRMASELLLKYADILRYQLYHSEKELIGIDQEIQFMKNYIEVEKYRWTERVVVHTEWNIDDKAIRIPPLLFIGLLENAFKFVAVEKNKTSFISILLKQKDNLLIFEAKNSIASLIENTNSSKIGLANLKKRLDLIYPERYLYLVNNQPGSYHVRLEIQY